MSQSILIFAAYGAPYEGNFIPSVRALAQKLQQQNIHTVLVLQNRVQEYAWTTQLSWCEETVYITDNPVQDVKILSSLIKKHRFIFVHTHFAESRHILSLKMAMLLCGSRIPMVDHHHARVHEAAGFLKKSVKHIIWSGDYMLACGEKVREDLQKTGLGKQIGLVENAIDFTRFPKASIGSKPRNVLLFGYNYHIKGVDIAVEAFGQIAQDFPEAKLLICVASGMEAIEQQLCAQFGKIPSWVRLLPPTADIASYYGQSAVYLCASREEGFCYAIVEAAYCGCTVISSRIDGPLQISIPEIAWFEAGNVQQLSQQLRRMLALPQEEIQEKAQHMRDAAALRYDISRWVDEVMDYYRNWELLPKE